jgi:hypothetical protein
MPEQRSLGGILLCWVVTQFGPVWLVRIVDLDSDHLKVGLKSNSVLESESKLECGLD